MCRNIKTLFNFDPPATDEEIRAASLQFVRKLSGFNKPSKANEAAFNDAIEEVSGVARRLIDSLVTTSEPRNREEVAAQLKARSAERFGRPGPVDVVSAFRRTSAVLKAARQARGAVSFWRSRAEEAVMLRNAIAVVVGMLMCAPAAVSGQAASTPGTPAKPFNAPKTPWGDPDLQGIWNFGTITPLERPAQFKDRATLTPDEVARLNEDEARRGDRRLADPAQDVEVAYNSFWWDRGTSVGRTSLIVDPPDGRLPPYTPEGRQRRETLGRRGYDSWADRALNERCMVYRPVPVRSSGYNNNNQIVQAPGYVAMLQEQIHEVRIIPLDGRPHLGQSIRPWLGDSRGRWEGNTLVVETTNFHPDTNYEGSGPNRTVIERFTLTDANTLSYEFTVNDPTTWTRAWTGQVPWQRDEGPIFEYACHEGNYGMVHLLKGARVLEAEAADEAKKQGR